MLDPKVSAKEFAKRVEEKSAKGWLDCTNKSKSGDLHIYKNQVNKSEQDLVVDASDPYYAPKAALALSLLRGTYFQSTNSIQVVDYKKWAKSHGVSVESEGFVVLDHKGRALSLMFAAFTDAKTQEQTEQKFASEGKNKIVQESNVALACFRKKDEARLKKAGLLTEPLTVSSALFDENVFLKSNNQFGDWLGQREEQKERTASSCLQKYGVHIESKIEFGMGAGWTQGYPVVMRMSDTSKDDIGSSGYFGTLKLDDLGTIPLVNPNAKSAIQNARDIALLNSLYARELFDSIVESQMTCFIENYGISSELFDEQLIEKVRGKDGFENLEHLVSKSEAKIIQKNLTGEQKEYLEQLRLAEQDPLNKNSTGATKLFGYDPSKTIFTGDDGCQYMISLDATVMNGQHSIRAFSLLSCALETPGEVYVEGEVALLKNGKPLSGLELQNMLFARLSRAHEKVKGMGGVDAIAQEEEEEQEGMSEEQRESLKKVSLNDRYAAHMYEKLYIKPLERLKEKGSTKQQIAEAQVRLKEKVFSQFKEYVKQSAIVQINVSAIASEQMAQNQRAAHNSNKQLSAQQIAFNELRDKIQRYCDTINDMSTRLGFEERLGFTKDISTSAQFNSDGKGSISFDKIAPIMMMLSTPSNRSQIYAQGAQEILKDHHDKFLPKVMGRTTALQSKQKQEVLERLELVQALSTKVKKMGAGFGLNRKSVGDFLSTQFDKLKGSVAATSNKETRSFFKLISVHAKALLMNEYAQKNGKILNTQKPTDLQGGELTEEQLELYAKYRIALMIHEKMQDLEQAVFNPNRVQEVAFFKDANTLRAFTLTVLARFTQDQGYDEDIQTLRSPAKKEALNILFDNLKECALNPLNLNVNSLLVKWYGNDASGVAQRISKSLEEGDPKALLLLQSLAQPLWNEKEGFFEKALVAAPDVAQRLREKKKNGSVKSETRKNYSEKI